MTHHLFLPLLLPLLTAVSVLLAEGHRTLKRLVMLLGTSGLLGYAAYLLLLVYRQGPQMTVAGGWPLPYGIALSADLLSAAMLLISALVSWVVLLYTFATVDPPRERFGFYFFYQCVLVGVNGAFLAGDLFNLYVWFEVMLIASFGLMTLGGERGQLEGGLKYVVINLVSSTIFLIAIGLLYGAAGTLNMAHLAHIISAEGSSPFISAVALLFLVSFGIKAAIFPLFFWLPASYHTPPPAVTALFGGLLTKVGVYALFRAFSLLFPQNPAFIHELILVLAGLTMSVGVLGAIAQNNVRRILSFHIISQIGYMLMGLGLFTTAGLAGGVFYIVHHIIVKTALLMVGGTLERATGSGELKEMGGQLRQRPMLATLFILAALSLAGVPPLSGFFSKLALLTAAVGQGRYAIAAVSLAVSVLTLFSMTKIWSEAFWKAPPQQARSHAGAVDWKVMSPVAVLVVLTVALGILAEPALQVARAAAGQLLSGAGHVLAVDR
jgi:multicomponent Na+:H+ antiporter subunit D